MPGHRGNGERHAQQQPSNGRRLILGRVAEISHTKMIPAHSQAIISAEIGTRQWMQLRPRRRECNGRERWAAHARRH